ncbi:hypothetical protein CRG98_009795, partial [Punica granatum]
MELGAASRKLLGNNLPSRGCGSLAGRQSQIAPQTFKWRPPSTPFPRSLRALLKDHYVSTDR